MKKDNEKKEKKQKHKHGEAVEGEAVPTAADAPNVSKTKEG